AGLPLRTADRWVHRYRQDGLVGLVRRRRKDAGTHRLPPALQDLIEGLALQRPAFTTAAIQRQATVVAKQQGWAIPSYTQVSAIVRQLDPALVTLAQEGAKAYRDRFDLLYRREARGPNEIWQADHTRLDIRVRDEAGQPTHPWFTVVLDDDSRAVVGFRVGVEPPSALRTALTLRQAIWPKGDAHWPVCGIPDTFYTDHGRDFTSHHLEQTAADLKMRLVFSQPGMPRGRGRIERFFGTVNQLFLCTLPGYAPAGTDPPPALTLADLDARLHDFLVADYHLRRHGETGVAPKARWEAGGFLPRLPQTSAELDLLLVMVPTPRRVQRDGIRFAGFRYLDPTLAGYVGETVTVRYDPRDLAEIRVFHQDRFLCRVLCQELTSQTVSLQEIVQARNARRRELRQVVAARRHIADQLLTPPLLSVGQEPSITPRLKRYLNQ
ncbi:MAG: putative transposase, partial [Thermomicrobiales bacterium]|nr:putative transposase [Thermomicrobiales bacterium]